MPFQIYTISQDGALFQWSFSNKTATYDDVDMVENVEDLSQWKITRRHYFMQNNAKVKCASYHASSKLLAAGFSNGLFGLYEMPDFNLIHSLRYVWVSLLGNRMG